MQRVKSGLKKERETILGGHTPHCLSSTENELIPLLVGLVSAGADASGTLDRQLDLKEFKTLMSFLKVVMCKGDVAPARLNATCVATERRTDRGLHRGLQAQTQEEQSKGQRVGEAHKGALSPLY